MTQPVLLAATDLEAEGARTADLAIPFARALGGRVELIHAADTLDAGDAPPGAIAVALDALRGRVVARRDEAERKLAAEADRLRASGIPAEGRLADGRPWRAVVDRATETGATLAVLARRARADWLAGPTVDRVIRHAPCAVVVAPPDAALPQTLAGARWVVGIDFSEPSRRALALTRDIAGASASIIVAFVVDPPMETYRVGLYPEADRERALGRIEPEVIGRVQADLAALAVEVLGEEQAAKVGRELLIGRPADALCDAASRFHADILVTGTTGRSGVSRALFGSVAEGVVRHAKVPVLVVP